jgi:hypothetical protein
MAKTFAEQMLWADSASVTEEDRGAGKRKFSACAWLLERRFPESFSRPERQSHLAIQNNLVENSLTINVTAGEAADIERRAAPIRESVQKMFERCRPGAWQR